ncbi:MAG: hypothetical protein KAS22_10970, partial [Candidatus Heimdallarchaeota archaeon]|nr:hypothetical protein [Candidatus Heimdallarchaeota archaeon]
MFEKYLDDNKDEKENIPEEGDNYIAVKKASKVSSDFKQEIKLDPNSSFDNLIGNGNTYLEHHELGKALNQYEKALA